MHERIISEDLWEDVQALISEHRVKNKTFKSREDVLNPLKGKIYCGECGSGMWRMSYASGDRRYKYYRCRTVKNSSGVCTNTESIRQDIIEEKVLEEFNGCRDKYYDKNMINLFPVCCDRIYDKEKALLIKNNAEFKNKLMQLYDDKIRGIINEQEFEFLKSENQKMMLKNEKRLELKEKEIKNKSANSLIDLSAEKLTFELVSAFIDKILVYKKEDNIREIEIKWNF